jgi:hypothetical protein
MNFSKNLNLDTCFNKRKGIMIMIKKKLKFMTTNYIDLLESKEKLNF